MKRRTSNEVYEKRAGRGAGIGEYAFHESGNLKDVYYGGEAQWKKVNISDTKNDSLKKAAIHYNTVGAAYPSTQTVDIDGRMVDFEMYALIDAAGNPANYVKVRDLAKEMNGGKAPFNVVWDGSKVNLAPKTAYEIVGTEGGTPFSGMRGYTFPVNPTYVGGVASDISTFVLTADDGGQYTYYKIRDLGALLGFNVSWTWERGMYIESDQPYSDAL